MSTSEGTSGAGAHGVGLDRDRNLVDPRRAGRKDERTLPDLAAPDCFGVPANLLGAHPEEVYGAVGRLVTLSALLEDRQRFLLRQLTGVRAEVYADLGANGVTATLRRVLRELPHDEPLRVRMLPETEATSKAFALRNVVVHSLWPAQPGDRVFGHKLNPDTGEIDTFEWTMGNLRDLVTELVRLIHATDAALMSVPLRPWPHRPDDRIAEPTVPPAPTLRGTEPINGVPDVTVADFWRWGFSELRTNTLRGVLAEYLVARAVGADGGHRIEWDPYDVVTPEGVRVEVKSAAYLQVWEQKQLSRIEFSGLSARLLDNNLGNYTGDRDYSAEVYVFAVQTSTDHTALDVLDVSQWDFYVARRDAVAATGRRSLGLAAVKRLAGEPVAWRELHRAVLRAGDNTP